MVSRVATRLQPAILAFFLVAGLVTPTPTRALSLPLRAVDWNAMLAADPHVQVLPDPGIALEPPGPYVSVTAAGLAFAAFTPGTSPAAWQDVEVGGYALTGSVQYGDLDGDGAEEAIISLSSGGTAGNLGFLLYREGLERPQLVAAVAGYKISGLIDNGTLIISQPLYFGGDANCCPAGVLRATYLLTGDSLSPIEQTAFYQERVVSPQELSVIGFYRALDHAVSFPRPGGGDVIYADAYAYLSPAFQAAHPFDAWAAGYANTARIAVETSPSVFENAVDVLITATERTPAGQSVVRRFAGSWHLVYSQSERRWLLDGAAIAEVP